MTSPNTFAQLGIDANICSTLTAVGIDAPFPIQAATIADIIAGRDVLGKGRTGSGKTLAFSLPTLTKLAGRRSQPSRPLAVILAPTRELATQIATVIDPYAKAVGLRCTTMFGGVKPGAQLAALKRGVEIVVACPGRLLDHHSSGHIRFDDVEFVIVDEADHMADQGFLPMLRRILNATPSDAQQLWFSATLDNGVADLVRTYMKNAATHSVADTTTTTAHQGTMVHHVVHTSETHRVTTIQTLAAHDGRSIVFCRTKSRTKRLCKQLVANGVNAVELHGNLAQNARERNLAAFMGGSATVLVATDIAARGIHVDDVGVVIHADPPVEHKAYVHRSGRTARAGADGVVVTVTTPELSDHVTQLMRKAHIKPTHHRDFTDAQLRDLTGRPASRSTTTGAHRTGRAATATSAPRSAAAPHPTAPKRKPQKRRRDRQDRAGYDTDEQVSTAARRRRSTSRTAVLLPGEWTPNEFS